MPKLVYNPVDRRPPPPTPVFALKLAGLVVIVLSLVGIAYVLKKFAGEEQRKDWAWDPASIRTNFERILTPRQANEVLRTGTSQANAEFIKGAHVQPAPSGNTPREPAPPDIGPAPVEPAPPPFSERDAHELQLAHAQITRARLFELSAETSSILDFEGFRDTDQTRCMDEFNAGAGRQAPPNERLALQILHKLAALPDYRQKIAYDAFFHGAGAAAIEQYRGHGFGLEGRLFDLFEVRAEPPYVMPDGVSVGSYFEGVVATLARGAGLGEQPIEQRIVIFHCLQLPPELTAFLGKPEGISHEDPLSREAVMVRISGAYLRRWIYSRDVLPFSTAVRKEMSQAFAPLLLCGEVARAQAGPFEVTDELLQQVRDSLREDPAFLETEAAYYTLLARAADPQDAVTPVEGLGYFDLAGSRGEIGPRYRGQGVRVVGMIGDDYAPVILPPNVSGLRRVFRALVVGDTGNAASPLRYMVDMLEPPTGLEPRAQVAFNARYYRNVFEARSTSSALRPLLIVRRVSLIHAGRDESEWIYGVVAAGAFMLMCVLVAAFALSDRRERRRFEATSMEAARKRMQRRGGLKLKPLPPEAGRDKSGPDSTN